MQIKASTQTDLIQVMNVWLSYVKVMHYMANSNSSLAIPIIAVRTKSKSSLWTLCREENVTQEQNRTLNCCHKTGSP